MAVAFVQGAFARTTGATSLAPALTGVGAGSTLILGVVGFATSNAAPSSVSDGVNTWNLVQDFAFSGTELRIQIYRAENASAGNRTVTVNWSNTYAGTAHLSEWTGVDTNTSGLLLTTRSGTGTAPNSTATGVFDDDGSAAYALMGLGAGDTNVGIDLPSGYTNLHVEQNADSYTGSSFDYKLIPTGGGTENPNWGTTVSGSWGGVVYELRADTGGGGGPTAPVVAARNTGRTTTTNTTSHAITLPTGITAGDLLVVVFSVDGNPTVTVDTGASGNNWNKLGQASNSTTVTGAIFWKVAEGSDALTLTTSASEQSSHVSLRITGHASGTPISGTSANGSSTNSDPPNHTPPNGSNAYLWIATRSGDSTTVATAGPTTPGTFGQLQTIAAAGTNGASTNTAEYTATASSVNPGTFTSATEQWVSYTLAIEPAPSGTTYNDSAALSGVGSVSAAATAGTAPQQASAALAGVGGATAGGTRVSLAVATLAAAGAVSAQGVRTSLGVAALAGAGGLAGDGLRVSLGAATLAGAGTLAATAAVGGTEWQASAALAGVGSAAAAGTLVSLGTATLAGTGIVSAQGLRSGLATAVLAGAGGLVAEGRRTTLGAAVLAGVGALDAAATPRLTASAALAGAGSLAGSAGVILVASASLPGAGFLAAEPSARIRVATVLAGAGTLDVSSISTQFATAALAGTGALVVEPRASLRLPAALAGVAGFSAEARRASLAVAALTGAGSLDAAPFALLRLGAGLTGAGAVAAASRRDALVALGLSGAGGITAGGGLIASAVAALAGAGGASGVGAGIYAAMGLLPGAGLIAGDGVKETWMHPSSDIAATGWTDQLGGTSNLFAAIDEMPPPDWADYVQSEPGETDPFEVLLTLPGAPGAGAIKAHYALRRDGSAALGCTVQLRQGTTVISEWQHASLPAEETLYVREVSGAERAAITNYSDLRLRFVPTPG
jgi:hypothetical protein